MPRAALFQPAANVFDFDLESGVAQPISVADLELKHNSRYTTPTPSTWRTPLIRLMLRFRARAMA